MTIDYSKVKPFVYVIVCADLSPRQMAVQAAHAALEAGIHLEQCKDFPSGMVILQVANMEELMKAEEHIHSKGIKCKLFWEDPLNRYTALATEAMSSDKRHYFRQFKLLSLPEPFFNKTKNWWEKWKDAFSW